MHRESGKAMQMQAVLMNREERLYQCEALGGGLGVSVNELTAAGLHVHFDLSTSKFGHPRRRESRPLGSLETLFCSTRATIAAGSARLGLAIEASILWGTK